MSVHPADAEINPEPMLAVEPLYAVPENPKDSVMLRVASHPWAVGATLAVFGAGCKYTETTDISDGFPRPLKETVESGAHPMIGYAGAGAAYMMMKRREEYGDDSLSLKQIATFGLVGATATNFAAEIGQDKTSHKPPGDFMHNHTVETMQDYTGSLVGAAILAGTLWLHRRSRSNSA